MYSVLIAWIMYTQASMIIYNFWLQMPTVSACAIDDGAVPE